MTAFQLCLALGLLSHAAQTRTDVSGFTGRLHEVSNPTQRIIEETHSPLLASFQAITDEIVTQAQELSMHEAMQLSGHVLEILKAIKSHHEVNMIEMLHGLASESTGLQSVLEENRPRLGVKGSPANTEGKPEPPQPSECDVIPDPYPAKSNVPLGHRKKIASEQHVPLAYFEAGYKGNVSSGDPRVFGPDAWRTLHRFSVHYPEHPNMDAQTACRSFLQGLPYLIPCPHCGYHLREFIVLNEQYSGEDREECLGTCTSTEEICRRQKTLVGFFARAHNNVNIHNYKSRPLWTTSDVYDTYKSGSIYGPPPYPYGPGPTPWVTQGPVDGKCQLIRSTSGQNVTGYPDFCKSGAAEDVLKNLKTCAQADIDLKSSVLL